MSTIFAVPRSIARRILPPRAVAAVQILFKRQFITYSRPYDSWAAAKRDATGYDDPAILQAVRKSASAVKEGRAAFEYGSLAYEEIAFRWPLLACLLHVALQRYPLSGRPLHILDFGGSLGSVYFQHRMFLERLPSLFWSIVEQPHFVQCGNAEFADERLRYFGTISEASARAPIECAIFSGSLEYLDMPYDVLAQIAALGSTYLILDRMHISNARDDQIMVQTVKRPGWGATLAIRYLARQKLLVHLDSIGYEVMATLPNGLFCERKRDRQKEADRVNKADAPIHSCEAGEGEACS